MDNQMGWLLRQKEGKVEADKGHLILVGPHRNCPAYPFSKMVLPVDNRALLFSAFFIGMSRHSQVI